LISAYGDIGCSKTVVIDFEMAAINGLREVFAQSVVKGCSFHFRQAPYRRLQAERLAQQYEKVDSEIRRWVRTTNVAEGWHNGLNSTFGVPHPLLGVFLDWLQIGSSTRSSVAVSN